MNAPTYCQMVKGRSVFVIAIFVVIAVVGFAWLQSRQYVLADVKELMPSLDSESATSMACSNSGCAFLMSDGRLIQHAWSDKKATAQSDATDILACSETHIFAAKKGGLILMETGTMSETILAVRPDELPVAMTNTVDASAFVVAKSVTSLSATLYEVNTRTKDITTLVQLKLPAYIRSALLWENEVILIPNSGFDLLRIVLNGKKSKVRLQRHVHELFCAELVGDYLITGSQDGTIGAYDLRRDIPAGTVICKSGKIASLCRIDEQTFGYGAVIGSLFQGSDGEIGVARISPNGKLSITPLEHEPASALSSSKNFFVAGGGHGVFVFDTNNMPPKLVAVASASYTPWTLVKLEGLRWGVASNSGMATVTLKETH